MDYIDIVPDTVDYPDLVNGNIDLAPVSLIEYALNNNPFIKSSQIYLKILEPVSYTHLTLPTNREV